VPHVVLPANPDPDQVFGAACAYAGQVIALDQCLAVLWDQLEQSRFGSSTLLSLIGASGFPLGEHGQIGPVEPALYAELIHVPWLLRLPDRSTALMRTQRLAQPPDLAATLADWLRLTPEGASAQDGVSLLPVLGGQASGDRDRALSVSDRGETALRTAAWFLRRPAGGRAELYAKPDDRWEVNDVADRCPDVVTSLSTAIDDTIDQYRGDGVVDFKPLDRHLVVPH
jgi:arylsulfatase A-like enzyme